MGGVTVQYYTQKASISGSPFVFECSVGKPYTLFFLFQIANPAMPPPRRSIVEGSGIPLKDATVKEVCS